MLKFGEIGDAPQQRQQRFLQNALKKRKYKTFIFFNLLPEQT
jgi:hypothetical protein